ncbi:MAG: hypothetical protein ACLFQ8_01325 [Candidatus Aenigmatarchaeota archaeon]
MPEDNFEDEWEKEIDNIVEEGKKDLKLPGEENRTFTSREYNTFIKEEEKHREKSLYEKLCNIAEDIVVIEPSEDKKEELQRSIDMAYMQITPPGAYSLAVLSGLMIFLAGIILMAFGIASIVFGLLIFMLGAVAIYLLAEYPNSQARLFRVKAADQIMLAIIYMVIYMRTSPNLEGAIKFTAEHLGEPLSLDFKKMLWDVETGKYISMKEALSDYLEKWQDNKPFVEAMQVIQNSMEQSKEKRKAMLDEGINTMMSGSREMMKEYSNKLELPIMIIHMLGIMLPIMVLVMFPIIILMLEDTVRPAFLFIGYNIILPLIIYLTGKRTLEYRPMGFSTPDISKHPDHIPSGMMKLGDKTIKIWPISLILSLPVILLGIYLVKFHAGEDLFRQIVTSLVITGGIAIGPSSYFLLDTRAKIELRESIKNIEDEFSKALFSLGNRMDLGKPIERAAEDTVQRNEDLEISNMFRKVVKNMRKGGMDLRNAFFDKNFGAVWQYPSDLVTSVMKIVVDATEKGSRIASRSAISISKYLEQLDEIEGDLKNMLSSETTSMQFLGSFLGPFVAGVSVAMAAIMMSIFRGIGEAMEGLGQATEGDVGIGGMAGIGMDGMLVGGWGAAGEMMPLYILQIVVGIYVIQTSYLLAMLTAGVENGPGDKVAKRKAAGFMILIGVIVYSFSLVVVWEVFGTQIAGLLGEGL